jgi:hypothetical protein
MLHEHRAVPQDYESEQSFTSQRGSDAGVIEFEQGQVQGREQESERSTPKNCQQGGECEPIDQRVCLL